MNLQVKVLRNDHKFQANWKKYMLHETKKGVYKTVLLENQGLKAHNLSKYKFLVFTIYIILQTLAKAGNFCYNEFKGH